MAPTAFCRISVSSDRQASSYLTLSPCLNSRVSLKEKKPRQLVQVSQRIRTIDFEDLYIKCTCFLSVTLQQHIVLVPIISVPDEYVQGGPEELRVVRCKLKIFHHQPTRPYKCLQLGKLRCIEHEIIVKAVEEATVGRVYRYLLQRGGMKLER
jgi:hypothetical protein